MPVGTGAGHHEEFVLTKPRGRHFGQDLALLGCEIDKPDPADLRQPAGHKPAKPVGGAWALDEKARETGQLQNPDMFGNMPAFGADGVEPVLTVIAVGRVIVFSGTGEPVGTLPATIGPEGGSRLHQRVIERRGLRFPSGRPLDLREVHRIFVAVGFDGLGLGIVVSDMVGEPARVHGPAVAFGFTLDNDLGQKLAGAAGLNDAEGKDAGFKGVRHAGHLPDQRQPVRRVRNRPIDDARDPRRAEKRHAGAGILDIPFQPLQIVGIELEGEILGHRIGRIGPVRTAALLIGPEKQAVLLLAKIVGAVRVAKQRQLAVACRQFGDRLGDQILVRQRNAGHVATEHAANLVGTIAGGIDDIFAADVTLRRRQDPFTVLATRAGDRTEPDHGGAVVTRALGKGLGQLRGVDVTVKGVPLTAIEIMRLEERIDLLHLGRRHFLKFNAHLASHALDMAELLHALARMRKPDGAGDVVIHRIVNQITELAIQAGRIALHLHHSPGADIVRAVAGGMPCRSGGQFVLFQKHDIRPAALGKMVENRGTDSTAANDDNPRRCRQFAGRLTGLFVYAYVIHCPSRFLLPGPPCRRGSRHNSLSIDRRCDHPDQNRRHVTLIDPGHRFAGETETVPLLEPDVLAIDDQRERSFNDISGFLGRPHERLGTARPGGKDRMYDFKSAAKSRRQEALDEPLVLVGHAAAAVRAHHIGRLRRIRALAEEETDRKSEESGHRTYVRKRRLRLTALDLRKPSHRPVKPVGEIIQRPAARAAKGTNIRPDRPGRAQRRGAVGPVVQLHQHWISPTAKSLLGRNEKINYFFIPTTKIQTIFISQDDYASSRPGAAGG